MIPETIALDSKHPPILQGHLPPSPCRVPQRAPRQSENREYLDKQINIFRQSELPEKEHAQQYLSHLYRKNCRLGTIESNQISVKLFLKFIRDQQGIIHLDQVTRQSIEAFVEYEQDRDLKPMTVWGRFLSVHAFLGFLVEGEVIDPNVLRKKIRVKVPEVLPKAIDPEDIKVFLKAVRHVRDRAMMLTLLRTGMRIGELLNTRICDINLQEKKVIIH